MTRIFAVTLFSSMALLFMTADAVAADRVTAGQWETKLSLGSGEPLMTKYCITADEARQMNGDLATLRKYLVESTAAATKGACAVKNVQLKDDKTIVTMVCGKTEVVGTTTYHGDRYESSSSNGSTVAGKRIGDCP